MPSPSIAGRRAAAPTMNGMVEFNPPASAQSTAPIFLPRNRSSLRNASMISPPCGIFSTITVGAPIMAQGTANSSSFISSTSISRTGPYLRMACCAISLPM